MTKLWAIVRREIESSVLTRSFLIGTIATPVILFLGLLIPRLMTPPSETTAYRIGILEVGGTQLADIGRAWQSDGPIGQRPQWRVIYQSLAESDTAGIKTRGAAEVANGHLDAFIIADTLLYPASQVRYCTTSVKQPGFRHDLQSCLTAYVLPKRLRQLGIDSAVSSEVLQPVALGAINDEIASRKENDFYADLITTVLFVMILLFTVIGYGMRVMRGMVEEKSTRMIEVLVSSMTPFQIMMGKITGQGIAALVQLIGWVAVGSLVLVLGQAAGALGNIAQVLGLSFALWFIIFLCLGYLFFSGWLSWVGAVVNSEQEAAPLMVPVIGLFSLSFLVGMVVVEDPSSSLARTLSFVPPLSPAMMIMRLRFSQVPAWEPALAAILLAGTAILIIWIGSRIFRVGILMQGKRPTVPEIVRWAKHG
jgi:ABC-2 type transport system permease protein